MTTPLDLEVDHHADGTVTIVATGEIDLSNIGVFTRTVEDVLAENGDGGRAVTLDLSAVDYLDSGGINVLFTHAARIRLIVKPLLIPVLTISGLTKLTTVETAPKTSY